MTDPTSLIAEAREFADDLDRLKLWHGHGEVWVEAMRLDFRAWIAARALTDKIREMMDAE